MDFLKKCLSSITLSAMAATLFVSPAQAALDFTDGNEIPSWAEEAIEELMDQGVISGNDDGSFAPNRQLNRAEVSKIIVLSTGIDLDTTGGPHFPDVDEGAWYYDYIETMYNQGWINGYPDGEFRPGVGINRAEIAKMVVNAFEIDQDLAGSPHFDDVSDSDWFYGYVETAYNNGLMRGYGDGTFGPANAVTRAETSKIVYDSQLVVTPIYGPAEGTLEVVLSDDTPRGTNIPYNATSVPFTTVELTASDDSDVEISSLTFTRLGLGDNDDFDNVWLEIDGFKVGNDKSINNDDVVELRFNPPIVVPAGQTIVADVVTSTKYATGDTNVGHHNRLALVSADDVVSTAANIAGDFPIEGEEMEVAEYEVSQIKFSRLGSDATIDVGDNFIEIGKFRMLNASNTNKDVELRAITFKNDGTTEIEDSLENVALYVSGEQVSAETIIDGDYVTFRLDNGVTGGYIIEDGDSRIFSMRADIVSAEKNDSINFKVDNFEDIVGVEIGTAFGVKAISSDTNGLTLGNDSDGDAETTVDTTTTCTNENAEDACARLRAYTVDSGDLNISRDPASLGNQQYAPGSNDVVFLTTRVVVDQPLIVDGIRVDVSSTTGVAATASLNADQVLDTYFDNFRLFLNDKLVDSENDFTDGASTALTTDSYLDFNTTFEIAGTSILKVVGNLTDGAATGAKIKLEVENTAFTSPEYISTGDQVTSTQVLGSAQGSFVEVNVSELIITRTDGLSTGDKIVAGVDDVTFLKFVLDNNDSGDVNVSSVTLAGTATGKARTEENFTAAVFVDGTQQGSSKNLDASGAATFNDLSVVIDSAAQKEFEVVVDTIEASATSVAETSSAATASTDVTISTANAAKLVVGDSLLITAQTAPATAAGTIATSDQTGLISAINTTTGVVTVGGATFTGPAVAGSAGVTTLTAAASPDATETTILTLPGGTTCTITYNGSDVGTEDFDCTDGTATLKGDQAAATPAVYSAAAVLGADFDNLILPGYTTGAGAATTTVFTETATPFVVGNITETGGSAAAADVTIAATTAGVATVIGAHPVALKHTLQLDISGVDADNVENGQTVVVKEGGATLSTTNELAGVAFQLVQSGRLTANIGSTVYSDLLVANSSDVEVIKLRLNAADDEIQIKDLYFENDVDGDGASTGTELNVESRVSFKMYNESGQLIQEKQMTGGSLHFELANQDRIRVPKDESTTITIKADIRDITSANQTGKRLQLRLNTDSGQNGISAVTAATGSDVDAADISASATGEVFVAHRTQVSVRHAATQPAFSDPSAASQQVYNFTVTADAARQAEIGRVTLKVDLSGMTASGGTAGAFIVRQVKDDGTVDDTATVATVTGTIATSAATGTATVDFINQTLAAGESRTYALFLDNLIDAGGSADDDSVSITIQRDTNYAVPGTLANVKVNGAGDVDTNTANAANANAVLIWSDESSTSHSATTADWMNGYLSEIDTTAKVNQD